MKINHATTPWQFSVFCPSADRVFLVKESLHCPSQWVEMQFAGSGRWTLIEPVAPGNYRFRYFAAEGNTYFNCGDINLTAQPLCASNSNHADINRTPFARPA